MGYRSDGGTEVKPGEVEGEVKIGVKTPRGNPGLVISELILLYFE